jgi:hypothetical protein
MTGGTSIKIFLPGGNPDGVRIVGKSHWTGIAVASPRSDYPQLRLDKDRNELRAPGVYVLVGPTEDAAHESRIYIGESENPQDRIDKHLAEKDFWNRLVVFTSYGETLNKATIRYLEARLLELAALAVRAEVDNGNVPNLPPLSEADTADAESFLQDMLVIFPILGINAFEPRAQITSKPRLHLSGPHAKGEGVETEDGFEVLAGALARADVVESMAAWAGWAEKLRNSLIESGELVPVADGKSLRLTSDHVFKSPSAAAIVLLGRSANGLAEWRDESGQTLKQIREQAVAMPTPSPSTPDSA